MAKETMTGLEQHKDPFRSNEAIVRKPLISDDSYWAFMESVGDGYFFDQSLHLFGKSGSLHFHDLDFRTDLLMDRYKSIIEHLIVSFGEDVFGNQFVFYNKGTGMFSLETGEIEFIADDFKGWLAALITDTDYFTGQSLIIEWTKAASAIGYDERLTPKIPFVAGGEFAIKNVYPSKFDTIISFNADLAVQIKNLPDGTRFKFSLE